MVLSASSQLFAQEQKLQSTESIPVKKELEKRESVNGVQSLDQKERVLLSTQKGNTIKERPVNRGGKEKRGTN